ncbi:DNA cytosine methyltransferase [Paenibacillus woosongensis]|uniref:DNA (cytosine-5-)-methyltransferase n=1 Tax=Paenibacillus woosongensis TaxID=307580 RepID=A0ABQ4MY01_9BACL|nr:DNA cytosine methyltransferase [Paenibacillus woosongensis]GIP60797.1 cytosine-specific methyltransferase [Paenibacillus woosongensis]
MQQKYKYIESFCGAGGLGLGLHQAGFEIGTAFDLNEAAVLTYQKNLSENCFIADASKLTGQELMEKAEVNYGELALFAGGPPCQGFSKQKRGAHLGDDERNKLVLEYVRLVKEIQPRFFLLENVAMLGQKRGTYFIEALKNELQEYVLHPHFYNSADYGLAQTRQRFIIVGKHKSIQTDFNIPSPTVSKWKTVGEILGSLPEPPVDHRQEHPDIPNHQRSNVTEKNLERFSYVPQGGGWRDIPYDLRLECHKNADTSKGGWPDVYGRLKWDGQAPTITGGFDSFTRGRYGHPLQNRPLTPREAALLQGFPVNYKFFGNRHEVRHQIGNAVPPLLAKAIGEEIKNCLLIEEESLNSSNLQVAISTK